MNGKDILIGLGYVDEQFIYEAESKKPNKIRRLIKLALPIAASFTLVMLSLLLYQNQGNIPPIKPNHEILPPIITDDKSELTKNYKLKFNNVDMTSSDNKLAVKGYFYYELSEEQINKMLPIVFQKHDVIATAHYSSENQVATLFSVNSTISIDENKSVKLTIAPNKIEKCYFIDGTPVISEIEGVQIVAGLFITDKNSRGERNYIYYADFKIDEIAYYVEYSGEKNDKDFFTNIIADIILGGKADLSTLDNPVIPELIDEELTETEAYEETDFGKYLFEIPNGYSFNGADRRLNQNKNSLYASWSKGYDDVSIQVFPHNEYSQSRMVSPDDTELYNISLYPIPWADSMPSDKRQMIQNPVFKIEDLTLDMIRLRGYTRNEVGDPSAHSLNMRFSVLYDDIIVEVSTEGLSSEYLFDALTSLAIK